MVVPPSRIAGVGHCIFPSFFFSFFDEDWHGPQTKKVKVIAGIQLNSLRLAPVLKTFFGTFVACSKDEKRKKKSGNRIPSLM